jgi:glycosyltransferase involved in cell wall biosynthesis
MKTILSHPIGNANVRAVANGLANEHILGMFYTAISSFPDSTLGYLSRYPGLSEIKRREYAPMLKPHTKMLLTWLEAGRLLAPKLGLASLTKGEQGLFNINRLFTEFDKKIAKKIESGTFNGIYAYEDGALFSFKAAEQLELPRFYDLPIGYWRTARILLDKEREKWPDWASTLNGFSDSDEKLARKDQELNLATRIIVASKFTASTLENYPGKLAPVDVIPYGFPPVNGTREYSQISRNRPLKLLFVGGLSQRKGIANLFSAVEKLKGSVKLTVIGRKNNDCPVLDEALSKHNWISSLSNAEILNKMREHDVLLFPSLFEGFGLVITEAMSQGTPVITTDRTAGPDLIEHGNNGWIIEAGSTEALQEAIENILRRPQMIEQAGRAALETAGKRPWNQYGKELAEAVKNVYLSLDIK